MEWDGEGKGEWGEVTIDERERAFQSGRPWQRRSGRVYIAEWGGRRGHYNRIIEWVKQRVGDRRKRESKTNQILFRTSEPLFYSAIYLARLQ